MTDRCTAALELNTKLPTPAQEKSVNLIISRVIPEAAYIAQYRNQFFKSLPTKASVGHYSLKLPLKNTALLT